MEDSANQSVEMAGAAEDPPPQQDRSASESLLDSTADSGPSQRRPPPPPSPLTGCYLLIVIGEPHSERHKEIILQKISKGFLSWDVNECHVSLEKELQSITVQSPEGEEARYGERLIQYATENLVTEILIHPQLNTLHQCMKNLLSSFTKHRHIIHAGYTFAGNGSWILQDGTLSISDLVEALHEAEVLRVLKAYENSVTIDVHCAPEGDWTSERFQKEPVSKLCKIRINPGDVMTAGEPAISAFINYLSPFLEPANIQQLLQPTDVVGNIRFTHPTLYVFPGGQGDAALFGINGFNMLVDGGFSRKACFWDFARHLDRLDAVLLTRLNNSTVNGISAVLQRKKMNHVYPQIGHFFCNLQDRRIALSPDGDKDKDSLIVNLAEEGQEIVANLKHLALKPHPCYRDGNQVDPVNLYHKVGHGKLDMYVISPARDSQAVKEFLLKWSANDNQLFSNTGKKISGKGFDFPIQNLVSICALLVWQPANPNDTITRILFPGSTPQHKIFEGLDKLRHLEFLKHPVCSAKSISPSSSTAMVSRSFSKTRQIDDKIRAKSMDNAQRDARSIIDSKSKMKATKPVKPPEKPLKQKADTNKLLDERKEADKIMDEPKLDSIKKLEDRIFDKDEKIENITKEIQKIQQESTIQRIEADIKKIDQNEDDAEKQARKFVHRSKYDMKNVKSKVDSRAPSKSIDRKKTLEKKLENGGSPPVTPKKALINGTAIKTEKSRSLSRTNRSSPSTTPGKSVKEANNRKVVEARVISRTPKVPSKIVKKEDTPPSSAAIVPSVLPTLPASAKTERKPISRRPKATSPVKKSNVTPVSKTKPTKPEVDSITKKVKRKLPSELDKTGTDSTVSTPSADVETTIIKDELREKAKEPMEIAQDAKTDLKDLTETEEYKPVDSNNLNELTENKETDAKAVKVSELSESKSPKEVLPSIEIEINRKEGAHDDEEEEYLIITKEEPEKEDEMDKENELDSLQDTDVKTRDETEEEGEIQKIHQDEEDSEKKRKIREMEGTEGEVEKVNEKENSEREEAPEAKKEEVSEESQKSSDKRETKESELQRLTDLDEGIDLKEPVSKEHKEGESLPDEKFSTTVETSATTAPTLPEDEKIEEPEKDERSKEKEEVEEKVAEVVEIEEKFVKEEIKDEVADDIQMRPDQPSSLARIPITTGPAPDKLQQKVHPRDLVKTPDEVADLPMHEEVDPAMYGSGEFNKDLQVKQEAEEQIKNLRKEIHEEFIKIDVKEVDKGEAIILDVEGPEDEGKDESKFKKLSEDLGETEKGEAENLTGVKEKPITAAEELTSKYLDIIEQLEKTTVSERSEEVVEAKEELKSENSYGKRTLAKEEMAAEENVKIDSEEDIKKESTPITFTVTSETLPVESTPIIIESKIYESFIAIEEEKVTAEPEEDLPRDKSAEEEQKKSFPPSDVTQIENRLEESLDSTDYKQTVHEEEIFENVEASLQKLISETEVTLSSSDKDVPDDKLIEKELESPEKLDAKRSPSASPEVRPESLTRSLGHEELPESFETKMIDQRIKETTQSLIESEKEWYDKDSAMFEKEEITSVPRKEEKLDIDLRESISGEKTPLDGGKISPTDHVLYKDSLSQSEKITPDVIEKDLSGKFIDGKESYENIEPDSTTEDDKSGPSAKEENKEPIPENLISEESALEVKDSKKQEPEVEEFSTLGENLEKVISEKYTSKEEAPDEELQKEGSSGKVTPTTTGKESDENVKTFLVSEDGKTSPVMAADESRELSPILPENLAIEESALGVKISGKQTPEVEESIAENNNLVEIIYEKETPGKHIEAITASMLGMKDAPSEAIPDISDGLILKETIPEQENSEKVTQALSGKNYADEVKLELGEKISSTATSPSTSGKGTPEPLEKETIGKVVPSSERETCDEAAPGISGKIVSGETTPTPAETEILEKASPELGDKIPSGSVTPAILESPGKTTPALLEKEKDMDGKTMPEMSDEKMISDEVTSSLLEPESSGKATPVLTGKEISGKATPEVAEKIPSVVISPSTSDKGTPDLSERESSGKESPALQEKESSGKATPEVSHVAISEKSTPALLEKDDLPEKKSLQMAQSEKEIPQYEYSEKLESEHSGKETPILPGNEFSGKVTPDTSERESFLPEKEISSVEKEDSQNVTPSRRSLDKVMSRTVTPDASGKDLSDQGTTISSEKDVSENISSISGKLSPASEENISSKIVPDEVETEKIHIVLSGKASPSYEVPQTVDSFPSEKTLSGKETPEKDDASISKYDVSFNAQDFLIDRASASKAEEQTNPEKLIEEIETDKKSILHRTGLPSGKSTPLDAVKSSSAASSLPESPAVSSGMISPAQDRRNGSESEKISVSDRSTPLDKDSGFMRNGIGDYEDAGELEKGILESEKHEKESQLTDDMSSGEEEELKALEHVEDADDSEPEEGITRERLESLSHAEVTSSTPNWPCDSPKRKQESSTASSTPAEHIMQEDVTSSPKGKKDDINNLVKIGGDSENQAAVKRMLVTACSEEGGVETEICPRGTIRLSKPEIQIKHEVSIESSDEERKEEFGSLISQAKKEYERQRSRKSSVNSPDHCSSDEHEENEEEKIMNSRNKEEFESLIIQAQKEYHLQRSRKSSGASLEEGDQVGAEGKRHESSAKTVSRTKWTTLDENDDTIEITTILTEEREEQEDGSIKIKTTKEVTTKGGENEGTVVTVEECRKNEEKVEKMEEGSTCKEDALARVEELRGASMEMSPLKTTYITSELGDAETLMTSSFYGSTGREEEVLEYKKEKGYESFTEIGPDGEKTEKTYFYGDDQEGSVASSMFMKGIPESIPEAPEMTFETFPARDTFASEDFAKAVDEHKLARGEYLGQSPGEKSEPSEQGEKVKDVIESWGKPLGLPLPPKSARNSSILTERGSSTNLSLSTPSDNSDSIINWGHPMNLPSPVPPATQNGSSEPKETPKKEKKIIQTKKNVLNDNKSSVSGNNTPSRRSESPVKQPERRAVSVGRNKTATTSFLYLDLTYVPHHGNSYYSNVEFFKRVRARYYVFSGTEPSKEVYNALLEAKQTWEDKDLEVTIIPTYDTDILGYWVAENEEILAKNKIDLSPSASRCTINLQDHETSCSAYRLEF